MNYDDVHWHLDYDPDTGIFRWLTPITISRTKNRVTTHYEPEQFNRVGQRADWPHESDTYGYLYIHLMGRAWLAHRLAWLYMTGSFPIENILHKNGQQNDNRWENLKLKDL